MKITVDGSHGPETSARLIEFAADRHVPWQSAFMHDKSRPGVMGAVSEQVFVTEELYNKLLDQYWDKSRGRTSQALANLLPTILPQSLGFCSPKTCKPRDEFLSHIQTHESALIQSKDMLPEGSQERKDAQFKYDMWMALTKQLDWFPAPQGR